MADPKEATVVTAVVSALGDIRVGADYFTDLGQHVSAVPFHEDTVNDSQLPAGYAIAGKEAPKDGCMGGTYGSVLEVYVALYVRDTGDGIGTEIARVKADVKKRLLTEPTLGGAVPEGLEWGGASPDLDALVENGRGWVSMRFLAPFDWTPASA